MKLLEREGPLAVLTEAHEAAREGRGSVVLVTGEPGIGKSALVASFAAGLPSSARVFTGTCDDLSIPRPLGPLRDLVGTSVELKEALAADAVPHQIHALLLDELSFPPAPTILIIEDVHWADEATVDTITVISRRIAERPALLILTFRSGEAAMAPALLTALGSIRSSASFYIQLAPLSSAAVTSLAGPAGERIFSVTGGNPFYVTELIAALPSELPPSVANSVLGRVAHLDEPGRRLVELVAMMPSRMPIDVLRALLPGWEAAAEEPEQHQLLQIDSQRARFRHELARRAVEESVLPGRRRRLHAQILEVLLGLGADPALIVHHAEAAGDLEIVAGHALLAARRAKAVESNREAFPHFHRAAQFADRLSIVEQANLFEELAVSAYTVDRLTEAFDAIERAISLYQAVNAKTGEGRCRRLLSRLHWYAGNGEEARQEAQAAVNILEQEGQSVDLALAYSGLSQLAMLASDDTEAIRWGGQALRLAEQLGNDRIKAHALINVGVPKTNLDPDDTEDLRQAFVVADRAGDRHEAVMALIALTWTFMTWVRPEAAIRYAEEGIAYAREHEVDTLLAYLNATSAWLKLRAGDWSEAEDLAAMEVQKGITVAQLPSKTVLAELAVRRGDDDARDRLSELGREAAGTGELQRIGPVLELEIEWALTRDEAFPTEHLRQVWHDIGPSARRTVGAARLAGWAAVAGWPLSFKQRMPTPYAAMAASDWRAGARDFGKVGWLYDRALMLSLVDDEAALDEALVIARSLGASPLADHVQRRLRERGWKVPRSKPRLSRAHPGGLTQRQGEVLDLIAEGLTNAEIAELLFISARTAEHHVEAILAKLGVSTRQEAVHRLTELRG